MKSLILLLLATMTCVAAAQQPQPCLELSKIKAPRHAVPRGGDADVVLEFIPKDCSLVARSVPLLGQPPSVVNPAFMPLGRPQIDTDSQPGLTVYERYLAVGPEHISAYLQITVATDVTPGKHDISAHLSYKAADAQENVTDQVLDFSVPVSVSRSVASNIPFPERHPVGYAILLPLAVIAYFPVCLVRFLIGLGGCGS